MRAFAFPLERVLAVRRLQLDIVEAGLKETLARKSYLRQRGRALEQQSRQLLDETARLPLTTGAALRSTDTYVERLARERLHASATERKLEQDRRDQLSAVVEARRRVRLLETLRSKKLRRHAKATARLQESEVAELHLGKWLRVNRRATE